MPIDLEKPIAWKDTDDPDGVALLQSLQGNILKGHGRKWTANIFFRFDPARPKDSRRMLRQLAQFHVTSAHLQLRQTARFHESGQGGGPFVHVGLSFAGYGAIERGNAAPADPDFTSGMRSDDSVQALLDPPVSEWEAPFREEIHGIVLAAHENPALTGELAGSLREMIEDAGGTIVHVQHGAVVENAAGEGIEHFGYVDGRSQPLMLVEDIKKEVAETGSAQWDAAFPLKLALVPDPGAGGSPHFGSYFIFRKLEQHVRDFKRREQVIADRLGLTDEDRELAGALIVGRFEDGTPVTLSDEALGLKPGNDFNYDTDPGIRCPFHAHIRKSNPRGTGGTESKEEERLHLMARRGIPYEDKKRSVHPEEVPDVASLSEFDQKAAPRLPKLGVGLLFMAYNENIGNQFKFTQKLWVNNSGFPVNPAGPHGIDPVIGQGQLVSGDQKLPSHWDDAAANPIGNVDFHGFVRMRGGEYFFSPSLAFLRSL